MKTLMIRRAAIALACFVPFAYAGTPDVPSGDTWTQVTRQYRLAASSPDSESMRQAVMDVASQERESGNGDLLVRHATLRTGAGASEPQPVHHDRLPADGKTGDTFAVIDCNADFRQMWKLEWTNGRWQTISYGQLPPGPCAFEQFEGLAAQ